MERIPSVRWGPLWALSFALWTVEGLFGAASEVMDVVVRGRIDAAAWEVFVWEISSAYAFAILTPLLVHFTLRFRFTLSRWSASLGLHLVAMLVFSLAHVGLMVAARKAVYRIAGAVYTYDPLGFALPYELFKDVLTFWMLVGLVYGFDYYRKYRERELQSAQLQRQLAQARLKNLTNQLQPHFLFNTLNTISAIMHEDVEAADRMIAGLSDLLRLAMEKDDRSEVPLHEEIETLKVYLDIMQARFHDRLTFDLDIDPDAQSACVPPLLLQPLVENAIKHGVGTRLTGGRVRVGATKDGGVVRLYVEDDGPGVATSNRELLTKGMGLSSTVERLEQLYGPDHRFSIENNPTAGLRVVVELPYRPSPLRPGLEASAAG